MNELPIIFYDCITQCFVNDATPLWCHQYQTEKMYFCLN